MEHPPSPRPGAFDERYFKTYYRDYVAQNPPRRLRFYAQMIERYLAPGAPRRIHDIGCAFGRFLGSLDPTWQIFGTDVSEFAVAQTAREHPRGVFTVAPAEARKVFDSEPDIRERVGWQRLRLPELATTYEKLGQLDKADPVITWHLADAYRSVSRFQDALQSYERALALEPKVADAEKIRAQIELLRLQLGQVRAPERGPAP